MSNDLTPKQEAFCTAYLETGNAAEAYRRAYDVEETAKDDWIYVEATQLLDHPKIAPRLKELKKRAEDAGIYNLQAAMEELEEARKLAKKEKNPSAMVSAINGKVKLFGLEQPQRTKHEITGSVVHVISPDPMTEDDWAAEHADEN